MKNIDNKKQKIAFVSDAIYPYNKGGKEKRLYEISTRLAKRGYDVHIYCMKWWEGIEKQRIENGVHLDAISKYYPLYSGKRRSIKQALMFAFSCFKLTKEDFDVIDADHMPHLVLYPLKIVTFLKRKKLIATWNEVWERKYWVDYIGQLGNIAYVSEWLSARMPDKIISISKHTTNKLKNDLSSKNEIFTIPAGVDIDYIQNVQPSSLKSDVIFVGRLLDHKNVDFLIKSITTVCREIPTVKCIIVGQGPEKEKLVELVHNLNLTKNIKFLGKVEEHDDVLSLIKSSKVLVLPSTREGFGLVAIEAMACGTPVITVAHDNNAASNIIHHGKDGFICELNTKEIAENIVKIIINELRQKMSEESIKTAKTYSWDRIVNEIEEVYLR
jgi:glycosyltransferase involved in cell wall biosynthesis